MRTKNGHKTEREHLEEACKVCHKIPSKYRCSTCPIRYCSVACYKEHKGSCTDNTYTSQPSVETSLDVSPSDTALPQASLSTKPAEPKPLRALSSLSYPPEPDPAVFTDPLLKDDPKPLRHEELLRIAQSPSLRTLLANPTLQAILRLLDTLPPQSRQLALSKLIGVDSQSLCHSSNAGSILTGRDSPPPLNDLLGGLTDKRSEERNDGDGWQVGGTDQDEGWWLSAHSGSRTQAQRHEQICSSEKNRWQRTPEDERMWITKEEKQLMRLFAGSVCFAIDGQEEEGEVVLGRGELAWDI
ncbi:uncharacterized protein L203_101673 [Cryptococcus depauperatus CBS 7841]|uniref:HIT-type domain-containing protein n=1 Tax=Cryptococcus depauperatus CBS 7841 TaxID=1295531 RepID=A0AAJ8JQH4_9TREE